MYMHPLSNPSIHLSNPFIHSIIHVCIRYLIHLSNPFSHSVIYASIHPSIPPSIHLSNSFSHICIHSSIYPSIQLYVHVYTRLYTLYDLIFEKEYFPPLPQNFLNKCLPSIAPHFTILYRK